MLERLRLKEHPVLGDIDISFVNKKTNKPFSVIAFVGENGSGKTTILNEIFDYWESKYVMHDGDANSSQRKMYNPLFLRQGSAFTRALNDIQTKLDGRSVLPIQHTKVESQIVKTQQLQDALETIGCKAAEKLLELPDAIIQSEAVVLSTIYRLDPAIKVAASTGEYEIYLKLKDIANYSETADVVLLDEPETSLHPKWQTKIVDGIAKAIEGSDGSTPQLFIATHSERVLESVIKRDDALIVRVYRKNGTVVSTPISRMGLLLPRPTFPELDYVIFGMSSYEYHNELFAYYSELSGKHRILEVDKAFRQVPQFTNGTLRKKWVYKGGDGKVTIYKTLPVYIRNWFHHPDGGSEPNSQELKTSLAFLRNEIAKMKKKD